MLLVVIFYWCTYCEVNMKKLLILVTLIGLPCYANDISKEFPYLIEQTGGTTQPRYVGSYNPAVITVADGIGDLYLGIDYNYIMANYDLSGAWKEYIKIKQKEQQYSKGSVICVEDVNISKVDLAKLIILMEGFIHKYPEFEQIVVAKQDFEFYVDTFINGKYTFETDGVNSFLSDNSRAGVKYLLRHGNPRSNVYKKVKEFFMPYL